MMETIKTKLAKTTAMVAKTRNQQAMEKTKPRQAIRMATLKMKKRKRNKKATSKIKIRSAHARLHTPLQDLREGAKKKCQNRKTQKARLCVTHESEKNVRASRQEIQM